VDGLVEETCRSEDLKTKTDEAKDVNRSTRADLSVEVVRHTQTLPVLLLLLLLLHAASSSLAERSLPSTGAA
jgi:hypothetical protein